MGFKLRWKRLNRTQVHVITARNIPRSGPISLRSWMLKPIVAITNSKWLVDLMIGSVSLWIARLVLKIAARSLRNVTRHVWWFDMEYRQLASCFIKTSKLVLIRVYFGCIAFFIVKVKSVLPNCVPNFARELAHVPIQNVIYKGRRKIIRDAYLRERWWRRDPVLPHAF